MDNKYTITMQVGKPVYSPKPKAVVEDLATGKKYHVGAGDSIVMAIKLTPASIKKLKRSKTVKYKVFKVDRQEKQVIIEDKKLKKYIITAKALMPRIKEKNIERNRKGEKPAKSPDMSPDMSPEFMEPPPGMS